MSKSSHDVTSDKYESRLNAPAATHARSPDGMTFFGVESLARDPISNAAAPATEIDVRTALAAIS